MFQLFILVSDAANFRILIRECRSRRKSSTVTSSFVAKFVQVFIMLSK